MHFAEKETLPGVRQSKGLNTKCHQGKENIIPNRLSAILLISFFSKILAYMQRSYFWLKERDHVMV